MIRIIDKITSFATQTAIIVRYKTVRKIEVILYLVIVSDFVACLKSFFTSFFSFSICS